MKGVNHSSIQKFQNLLKRVFQFDASDLDFGIYRILNYKRDRIERFIHKDLVERVETAFARYKGERLRNINKRFHEIRERVIQELGHQALTLTGEIKEEFKNTPLGRDFLSLKSKMKEAEKIDEIKIQVFNDLYSFFSRYYEEGDFVPQYRYSIKKHKYAIPYNGEEVKLYWANSDQYYIKTGLLFRDYTFKLDAYKIIFRIVQAKEEVGSKKATKQRFFILDDENPLSTQNKNLIIRFQYRELTEEEVKNYGIEGGSNTAKQEKINQKNFDKILKMVKNTKLKGLLSKEHKNEKPLLLHQISRFTAKNTKDYFIHKNLKKFLSEQLDYFIKSEVLDIETLEKKKYLDKHITRAKVVREIGEDIIDFLSQIEGFQKRLWEKKKFVLKTEYVITTDRIPEEFYEEILKNEEQRKEWEELGFEIATPSARNDNKKRLSLRGAIATKQSLKDLHLPVDTKHFSQEFKEKLLEKLTNSPLSEGCPEGTGCSPLSEGCPERTGCLDDLLDGLLIKSENWQALNLLLGKYKEKVKCIYIDPPYNTGSDEFLYRDRYQHSSWLSMMKNRLELARKLMREDGVIFVSIDEREVSNLKNILDFIFNQSFLAQITIVNNWKGRSDDKYFATCNEFLLSYAKYSEKAIIKGFELSAEEKEKYDGIDEISPYKLISFRKTGKNWRKEDRPNLYYPIYYNPSTGEITLERKENFLEILPLTNKGEKGTWRWYSNTFLEKKNTEIIIKLVNKGKRNEHYEVFTKMRLYTQEGKERVLKPKTTWIGAKYDTGKAGERLDTFFGRKNIYTNPKSELFILDILKIVTDSCEDYILDFFAGSGTTAHAVMKLNKEDGGKRKYILIEMADYFGTVIIPRLKKLCYSFNWKDGKPQDTDGISQFFKYQILEQYEDTLDNIELNPNEVAQNLFKDKYLLKYFLDYETRENPYLLNINMLKNPFSYKLKVNLEEVGEPQEVVVDIPETFNYLLGLKVKKIKARYSPSPKGCQAKPNGVVHWKDLPFNPKLKEKARKLRKAGNLSEVLFWQKVKNKQFLGLDFDRQKIIGNYIVDFFCKNLGIVVEIDGQTHDFKVDYNRERDKYLESLGLKVFHIQDKDIRNNLDGVMEWLKREIENTPFLRDTPLKEGNTPSANADTPLKEGNRRKYLFILGEKEGKDIGIVWREYDENWDENDFKKDKEFIIKELEPWSPHIVYVNGQSILTPKLGKHNVEVRYIEPEFKKLMER